MEIRVTTTDKYEDLAKMILEEIGGWKNIVVKTEGNGKLYFILRNSSVFDPDELEAKEGITRISYEGGGFGILTNLDSKKLFSALKTAIGQEKQADEAQMRKSGNYAISLQGDLSYATYHQKDSKLMSAHKKQKNWNPLFRRTHAA